MITAELKIAEQEHAKAVLLASVDMAINHGTSFHDIWFYRLSNLQRSLFVSKSSFEQEADDLYRRSI